jgi:hypothetical protein
MEFGRRKNVGGEVMRKTVAVLGIFALMFLGLGFSATAQTGTEDTGGYARTADDDGPDLGWIGLLGLAGLLGLRRREVHRDVSRPATHTATR